MKKIGLFGGTFDPPHIGHFIIAEEVKYQFELDEIWFIPTNEPPHKAQAYFSPSERLEMLQRTVDKTPGFAVKDMELKRQGKSYTIDTIKNIVQHHLDDTFYFIIGGDMVEYLPKWEKIDELMELITFIGVKRPHYDWTTDYMVQQATVPLIDISSTYIREQMKSGRSMKYFLPHEVYCYRKDYHK